MQTERRKMNNQNAESFGLQTKIKREHITNNSLPGLDDRHSSTKKYKVCCLSRLTVHLPNEASPFLDC